MKMSELERCPKLLLDTLIRKKDLNLMIDIKKLMENKQSKIVIDQCH
jgi:hypothetical protein